MFGTDLSLSQLLPQGLDGDFLVLDLGSAVLQLCLQQLGGLFVGRQSAVSFELILLQLLLLCTQSLKT